MFATRKMVLRLEGAVLASILGPHFLIFVTALRICHQSEGLGLCRQQPQGLPDPQAGSPRVLTPEFGAVSNGWTRKPVRSPPCHCEPRKPSSSLAGPLLICLRKQCSQWEKEDQTAMVLSSRLCLESCVVFWLWRD